MHYSDKSGHVRADRFRDSGKWYDTIVLDMTPYWKSEADHIVAVEAVKLAYLDFLRDHGWTDPWSEGFLVVMEPYHQFGIPVLVRFDRGGVPNARQ